MEMANEICNGCGSETGSTIETWDEGDGWVSVTLCPDCVEALDNICDRCGVQNKNISGTALCQKCIDDYNRGEHF